MCLIDKEVYKIDIE